MTRQLTQTETFEAHLRDGREAISQARDVYSTLTLNDAVPESIIGAIGDLERELDELDQTLAVTSRDIGLASQTARRTSVLASVFSTLGEQQRIVVEAELSRLQSFIRALGTLCREVDTPTELDSRLDRLKRRLSMLQELADSDRHGQVIGNDRLSLATVDADARRLDGALAEERDDQSRTTAYVSVCKELLEWIHQSLAGLDGSNPDKTAFGTDLGSVKDRIENAETALKANESDRAVEEARIALEGTFMIHQLAARATARQHAARALTSVIQEANLSIECDTKQYASEGDVDTILSAINERIRTQVEQSVSERLLQLLREHDGSVVRTVQATDFDVPTVLEGLGQLHSQQQIEDIEVVFER